jgi:penicillin amidase
VPSLSIPGGDLADKYPWGFPRHGGYSVIDASSRGVNLCTADPDHLPRFDYHHGPSQRFVVELDPDRITGHNAIPGGQVGREGDPHYDDQMIQLWRYNKTHPQWFYEDEVVANAVQRIRFVPKK